MTILSCRNRDVRLHIAYIIDAYMHNVGNPFSTNIKPADSVSRLFHSGQHPYAYMWEIITHAYQAMHWDDLCDTELDDIWKTAISVGLELFDTKLTPQDILRAKQRWFNSHWYRYEFKRTNRRMAVAPWLRIGMVGV